jgi:hypothetical protein
LVYKQIRIEWSKKQRIGIADRSSDLDWSNFSKSLVQTAVHILAKWQ